MYVTVGIVQQHLTANSFKKLPFIVISLLAPTGIHVTAVSENELVVIR